MLNILKSDFYKLRKSKAFWICTVLCAAMAVLFVVAIEAGMGGQELPPEMATMTSGVGAMSFLLTMDFHLTFIAVFVAIFVASEFQNGTIKNVLSKGAGRTKVFFSKFIVSSFASVMMLLSFVIAALLLGSIVWGYDPGGMSTVPGLIGMVSLQGLMVLAFTALFTFAAMTLKGTGGAIGANVISVMMVPTLLAALSMILPGDVDLSDFWLGWGVSNLATYSPPAADVTQGIIIALAWGLASIVIGNVLFQKQDVK